MCSVCMVLKHLFVTPFVDIPTPPTSPPVMETNSSRGLSVVMFPEPPRGKHAKEIHI